MRLSINKCNIKPAYNVPFKCQPLSGDRHHFSKAQKLERDVFVSSKPKKSGDLSFTAKLKNIVKSLGQS